MVMVLEAWQRRQIGSPAAVRAMGNSPANILFIALAVSRETVVPLLESRVQRVRDGKTSPRQRMNWWSSVWGLVSITRASDKLN